MGAIVGIIGLAAMKMFQYLFNSNAHVTLKADEISLRNSLSQLIDCNKTFLGNSVIVATDCLPAAPKPLLLRDKNNNPITSALEPVTGTFNPQDATFQGSGKLGDWFLRAYCDSTVGSLVIRVAKSAGSGAFQVNPLTKQPIDWSNRSGNPSFGTASTLLCSGNVSTTSTFCTEVERQEAGQKVAANACTNASGFTGSMLCDGHTYKNITFATPFQCIPHVQVSAAVICDSAIATCTGGATDQIGVYAENITKTGFRLVCEGSPVSPLCGVAGAAMHCPGQCNWVASGK